MPPTPTPLQYERPVPSPRRHRITIASIGRFFAGLTAYVVVVKLLWQLDAAPAKAFLARLGLGNGTEALLALIPLGLLAWGIYLQHKRHRIGFTLGVLAGVALSGVALVLYLFFLSWALSFH